MSIVPPAATEAQPPTPYYEDEFVTLFHGDCRELLASLDDRSVDCVITDPPYSDRTHEGTRSNSDRAKGHGNRVLSGTFGFDSITEVELREVMAALGRITRRWVVSSLDYRQGWEAISFMHRTDLRPTWNGGGRAGVWFNRVAQNEGHPTSKPLPMIAEWVRLFTNPGDTILDPFAGSGTTLRAAKDEGRKAIGIELDERYCEIAAKRLTQDTLFGDVANFQKGDGFGSSVFQKGGGFERPGVRSDLVCNERGIPQSECPWYCPHDYREIPETDARPRGTGASA